MSRQLCELTRVQIPAMVHLTTIGYEYYGKISEQNSNNIIYDSSTNILTEEFCRQFRKINNSCDTTPEEVLSEIRKISDYDDLGKSFYNLLTNRAGKPYKLIDFDNIYNNSFKFTAEFSCRNDGESFRPDITLFVNGLPLSFIEVKKPNNQGGMLAEYQRMSEERFKNKKFRRFLNITQLMLFTNNMPYSKGDGHFPIQGSFYCTTAKSKPFFNCFREENPNSLEVAPFIRNYPYKQVDEEVENLILRDMNHSVIQCNQEYKTNKSSTTITNSFLTSMCSPERLLFLLKYGFAYVKYDKEDDNGNIISINQKHIMRYQQFFGAKAVVNALDNRKKSGIIWHTQGSGKTALAYYLTNILTDYYSKKEIVPKFYFVVDRLDLLSQSKKEFAARGLKVNTVQNRTELKEEFLSNNALSNNSGGESQITVINIQKFGEKDKIDNNNDYATNLQRIFIVDEAHRSYKPGGSFLANLFDADQDSVKLALTGTPLLEEDRSSKKVFGDYIHTYYYDKSIDDGYTLKLQRVDIETSYKLAIRDTINKLEVKGSDITKDDIFTSDKYVNDVSRYIIQDLVEFRSIQGDKELGGMVICSSSEQAYKMFNNFKENQDYLVKNNKIREEDSLKCGLVLCDHPQSKDEQRKLIEDFKVNMKVDILFVYAMLLTGFDAPRLKRLYIGRQLDKHTLLQALTRVNRTFKNMNYGYIVDFADIKKNFDETNAEYLKELNEFNNPNCDTDSSNASMYSALFESSDQISAKINESLSKLFEYDTSNLEMFSNQIEYIEEIDSLKQLETALRQVKDCYNYARTIGNEDLKAKSNIPNISDFISEVRNKINLLYLKQSLNSKDKKNLEINSYMYSLDFVFSERGKEELKILAGKKSSLNNMKNRILVELDNCIDKNDEEYITLLEAIEKLLSKNKIETIDAANTMDKIESELNNILIEAKKLNNKNHTISQKYSNDNKYVRLHKPLANSTLLFNKETDANDETIHSILTYIKNGLDDLIDKNRDILNNGGVFEKNVMRLISKALVAESTTKNSVDREKKKNLQKMIVKEYYSEFNIQ